MPDGKQNYSCVIGLIHLFFLIKIKFWSKWFYHLEPKFD